MLRAGKQDIESPDGFSAHIMKVLYGHSSTEDGKISQPSELNGLEGAEEWRTKERCPNCGSVEGLSESGYIRGAGHAPLIREATRRVRAGDKTGWGFGKNLDMDQQTWIFFLPPSFFKLFSALHPSPSTP